MFDPRVEPPITLVEAADEYEKLTGHRPGQTTFTGWAINGVGPNKIKLETAKYGGKRKTSKAAIARFVAALNPETETVKC